MFKPCVTLKLVAPVSGFTRCVNSVYLSAPASFEVIAPLVKSVMSPETRRILHIYGFEREKWLSALQAVISGDELPAQYGGSRRGQARN